MMISASAKSPCAAQRNIIPRMQTKLKYRYLERPMSFRLQPAAPARPNRCQLFGPGSNTKLFEKMAASAA
ncbi:MAG: hypothetical protein AAF826_13365, partial [Pseudomonadota bacterium]